MPDLSSAQTKYLSRLKRENILSIFPDWFSSQAFWLCGKSLPYRLDRLFYFQQSFCHRVKFP